MRIAVISDTHGNCVALDAVLDDLKSNSIDQIVCLGDEIQGGPQPAETVERLRALGCPVVMGNADSWLLTGQGDEMVEPVTETQRRVREWSLARLSGEDIKFIEGFQPTVEIALDEKTRLLCFHGSPASFDELIFPETSEDDFQRMLGVHPGCVMCGGHTHLQQIRRIGDYFFFNPGSVGVAYNRHQPGEILQMDPWAEYAILASEAGRLNLEFRRVPFDVSSLIQVVLESGRPNAQAFVAQYKRA